MGGRGFDRAVAVLELLTGLGVAAYMMVLGVSAESGGVAFFVLAAVFLAILAAMSRTSWRRVRAQEMDREDRAREHPAPEHHHRVTTMPLPVPGDDDVADRPALSEAGRVELARVVAVLADAGLFAPRVPDPADLEEAVADWGEPVDQGAVLAAPHEAGHYHPGFRPEDHLGAVDLHDTQVEQFADTLHWQAESLDRLVGDAMTVRLLDAELVERYPVVRTRLRLRLDDDEQVLEYDGDGKYLSDVLHVAVARALRERTDTVRLASFWVDMGMWVAALRAPVTVETLNAALGPAAPEEWTWLDEQEPMAAGTLLREAREAREAQRRAAEDGGD